MAKFCTNCGRPLKEGEICECQKAKTTYRPTINTMGDNPVKTWVNNMFGLHESDLNNNQDCFEFNQHIVPNAIASCEGEIPVKQYELATFRSRIEGLLAFGRLQITNKRIIFRASGRSILGRTTMHCEYKIDEIAGLSVSQGIRFSWVDFILCIILFMPLLIALFVAPTMILTKFSSSGSETAIEVIGVILGLALLVPFFILHKKMFLKGVASTLSTAAFLIASLMSDENVFFYFLTFLALVISLVSYFFYALKPSVSLAILCKGGTASVMTIASQQIFKLQFAHEVIPTKETALAVQEVGSIVDDIQKLGDFGIEKWQQDCYKTNAVQNS